MAKVCLSCVISPCFKTQRKTAKFKRKIFWIISIHFNQKLGRFFNASKFCESWSLNWNYSTLKARMPSYNWKCWHCGVSWRSSKILSRYIQRDKEKNWWDQGWLVKFYCWHNSIQGWKWFAFCRLWRGYLWSDLEKASWKHFMVRNPYLIIWRNFFKNMGVQQK